MADVILDALRHGEPVGGRRYRGHGVDDPLSEKGWRQMWQAVENADPWNRIVTSPLVRCRDFAEALGRRHGVPVQVEPDLREVGFGAWEGRTPHQVREEDPEGHAAFYRDPVRCRPAGAEDLEAFGRRVAAVYDTLATTAEREGERVLMVVHAGVIRAMVGHVLQAPPAAWYRVQVDHAAITRFCRSGGIDRLLFHNRLRLE